MPQARAEHHANVEANRTLRIVADTAMPLVHALVAEVSAMLLSLSPSISFTSSIKTASHVLVVLSGCLLQPGSPVEAELHKAVLCKCELVFLYSSDCGWDFQRFCSTPDRGSASYIAAGIAVAKHEAIVFRSKEQPHEQRAMALELLRRMRPAQNRRHTM